MARDLLDYLGLRDDGPHSDDRVRDGLPAGLGIGNRLKRRPFGGEGLLGVLPYRGVHLLYGGGHLFRRGRLFRRTLRHLLGRHGDLLAAVGDIRRGRLDALDHPVEVVHDVPEGYRKLADLVAAIQEHLGDVARNVPFRDRLGLHRRLGDRAADRARQHEGDQNGEEDGGDLEDEYRPGRRFGELEVGGRGLLHLGTLVGFKIAKGVEAILGRALGVTVKKGVGLGVLVLPREFPYLVAVNPVRTDGPVVRVEQGLVLFGDADRLQMGVGLVVRRAQFAHPVVVLLGQGRVIGYDEIAQHRLAFMHAGTHRFEVHQRGCYLVVHHPIRVRDRADLDDSNDTDEDAQGDHRRHGKTDLTTNLEFHVFSVQQISGTWLGPLRSIHENPAAPGNTVSP